MAKTVAVMACPTGIAHTIMTAKALEKTAKSMGHTLRAKMQGSIGVRNAISEQEINEANFVLGISFITDGAIPYVARDPLRVLPGLMVGSSTAALSMAFS